MILWYATLSHLVPMSSDLHRLREKGTKGGVILPVLPSEMVLWTCWPLSTASLEEGSNAVNLF